jgi:hypothetical protein
MQYIERRTRLYIAAFAAAALIIALTLGLTLGLGGTPQSAHTIPTVPITGVTVPTSLGIGLSAAKTELAARARILSETLSQFPDPATYPIARILTSVAAVDGILIGNVTSGPERLLNVRFNLGGYSLDECFTLGPHVVTSKVC